MTATIRATPLVTQIAQDPRGFPISSVAVDSERNIYVFGQLIGIARVNPLDGTLTNISGGGTDLADGILAINAALPNPARLIVDLSGNLVFSEGSRVRRIDLIAGTITTIAGTLSGGFAGDGGPATRAQLNSPQGLAFDASGNLFIADSGNQRVRRVDVLTGTITTVAGGWVNYYAGSIGSPTDVTVTPGGDVLIASPSLARVYRVDEAGAISVFAGNGASYAKVTGDGGPPNLATLCNPGNLKFDSNGNLFIADRENFHNLDGVQCGGGLRRVDANTGVIQTVLGDYPDPGIVPIGGISIGDIEDIAVSGDNLYVATYLGALYQVTPASVPLASSAPEIVSTVDAANFQPTGFSPGEIISIIGNYLAPTTQVPLAFGADGRVTTTLGGVQLFMAGIPAPLLYVSAGQINAIVPYGSPLRAEPAAQFRLVGPYGEVVRAYRGIAISPGVFTSAVLNPDGSPNTLDHPAPQGANLVFYATGLGQTSPVEVDGAIYMGTDLPAAAGKVSVLFAGQKGQVFSAGQVPGQVAGLMQVSAQMPPDLPGIVPVDLLVDGTSGATLSPTTQVFVEQSTPPPVISNVFVSYANPWVIATVGLRPLVITGNGFDPQAVVELYFNGTKLATVKRDAAAQSTSSLLYASVNFGGFPGTYAIAVVNPPNGSSTLYSIQVYAPSLPFIYNIIPAVPIGSIGPQTITVSGAHFQPGLSLNMFYGSQQLATYSGSQLTNFTTGSFSFVVDLLGNSGTYGLQIVNPDGQRSPYISFTAQPGNLTPRVVAISPTNPIASGLQTIAVTGENFLPGLSADLFYNGEPFSHLNDPQVMVDLATSASLSFDFGGQAGSYGMELVNPAGQRSQRFAFTVQPPSVGPTINSIAPVSLAASVIDQEIIVFGSGFQAGASVDLFLDGVSFTSVSGTNVVIRSATSLTVSVNFRGMAGNFGMEVADPGNLRSRRFPFTVLPGQPAPVILGMEPRTPRPTEGAQDIQVSGTGFQPGLIATLRVPPFGNLSQLPYQVLNVTPSSFTLRIDFQGRVIELNLQITNPDGRKSFNFDFCSCGGN